jgi:hypothetical protein
MSCAYLEQGNTEISDNYDAKGKSVHAYICRERSRNSAKSTSRRTTLAWDQASPLSSREIVKVGSIVLEPALIQMYDKHFCPACDSLCQCDGKTRLGILWTAPIVKPSSKKCCRKMRTLMLSISAWLGASMWFLISWFV